MEIVVPEALQAAAESETSSSIREGLPSGFMDYMGVQYEETQDENLPDFSCGKCNKVFNEFAKVMLHKKGSYLTCETEKERKKRKKRNFQVSEEDLKLKNFKEHFFNQNKPILFQDCMEVRLGKFFVFFTLSMLCLGAAHLSKLYFFVL